VGIDDRLLGACGAQGAQGVEAGCLGEAEAAEGRVGPDRL
jgi:hypothetical protein